MTASLALELKAQTDFERVFLTPVPQLRDTNTCIQTQASMVPMASPEDLPLSPFPQGLVHARGELTINGEPASSCRPPASSTWQYRSVGRAERRV